MIKTSIIIPTHNDRDCVKKCIDSIINFTNNYEIIFVLDNSVTFQKELEKYGKVICVDTPYVFAHRINLGIKASDADYVCLLNDDTIVAEDWLIKMINTDKHLGAGMIGAQTQKRGCSNCDAQLKGDSKYTNHTINMFATLISRRILNVVGLLDERFISYGGEDDDYALRVLRHGFKLIISDGYVYHEVGLGHSSGIGKLLKQTNQIFQDKWNILAPRKLPEEHWADNIRGELSKPLISVLMPTRNHEKYIKESIQSILVQSYTNFELLIGVDGSDQQETIKIIKSFDDKRIKYYTNMKQLGSCLTRNILFDNSKGEYIALMDSDDIMLPKRLQNQLEIITSEIDIVHSSYIEKDKNGNKKIVNSYPINKNLLLNDLTFVAGGTFLMRRCILEKEKFNKNNEVAFDFAYVLKNYNKFNFKFIIEPTIIYNRHSGEHLSGNLQSSLIHKKLKEEYSLQEPEKDRSLRSGERQYGVTLNHIEKNHLWRYKETLQYIQNKAVLDVGCGVGYGSFLMSNKARYIRSLDDSKEAIDFANKNYRKSNIKHYCVDFLNMLPYIKDKIEVVVAFEVIEHIKNTDKAFEIFKKISPDLFIISVPHLQCPLGGNKFHHRHYGIDELVARFYAIGYKPKRAELRFFGKCLNIFLIMEKNL